MEGSLSISEYLWGLVLLLGVLGAAGFGAHHLVVKRASELPRAQRALGTCVVAVAALILIHVVPAALGILARWSVLLAAGAWVVVALTVPPHGGEQRGAPPEAGRSSPVAWAGSLLLAAVFVAVVLAVATRDATQASTGLDMVNFHLPDVATWIRDGSIWEINQFVPLLTHGNYPQNGDFVLLAVMQPWDNDFLVRLTMLPFLALLVFAVYVAARELNAPPAASLAVAVALASMPIVGESAVTVGLPDVVMWSCFAAGIAFLLRQARTGAGVDLVLGGVALGVAFGTKWYGVSAVMIVVAVWAGASLLAKRSFPAVARGVSLLAGFAAVLGGIWLVRNWIESGNPGFPVRVAAGGVTIFDAPFDVMRRDAGFTIAGYLDDPSVWKEHLLPTYRDFVGAPALGLGLGVLAAGGISLARSAPDRGRVIALAACSILLAAMYSLLPYSAQGIDGFPAFAGPNTRYLVPSLIVAAPAVAWLARRFPAAEPALVGLAGLAVLQGLTTAFDLSVARFCLFLLFVAVIGFAVWVARGTRRPAPITIGLAAGALALAVAAAGYEGQQRFNDARYRGIDATYDWMLDNASSGRKVALAGDWSKGVGPPFPMFGPRLGNEVKYLGRFEDELLRKYPDQRSFATAIQRGRFDLLTVGRGFLAAPGAPPRKPVAEERWARAAGLEQVAQSDMLTLYRVPRSN